MNYFRNTTSGSAEVLEENNYYAFGMKHDWNNALAVNPAYNYQYNGKELQTETGWNDYGARMYMSDIGRWGVIDPLAEQMRRYSPYNYAFNNPVIFIDPDGRKPHNPLEFYGPNSAFNLEFDPLTSLYGTPFNDVGRSPYLRSSLPNQWYYGGSGDYSDDKPEPSSAAINGSSDGLGEYLIQEVVLSGNHSNWGKEIFEAFEDSMKNWDTVAMAYTGTLTFPTGGGASAGTWASIRGVLGELAGLSRFGIWTLPLMLNGDSSHARGYDIPLTEATDIPADRPQNNLYLYRIMRNVNGLPMVGTGLDKLGLRDRDINNLPNSSRITNLFENGLSVTAGYGNVIPPNVPDFSGGKGTLFRIPASSLISYGLIGVPVPNANIPNYGQIRPAVPMTVGAFRALIQSTAPAWQPVK